MICNVLYVFNTIFNNSYNEFKHVLFTYYIFHYYPTYDVFNYKYILIELSSGRLRFIV